jgi:hypothetical protein
MRTTRVGAALLVIALAGCTASSNPDGTGSTPASSLPASASAPATPGCPADTHTIQSLFGEPIEHVEGEVNGSTEQVCAFSTSTTDLGALSVAYLRFPRPELGVKTLAEARQQYGSPLAGHTIVSMPSWGADAFLDETMLPSRDLVAEFAWVPGFEIILGMHADDRHVAQRRELIDKLVTITR